MNFSLLRRDFETRHSFLRIFSRSGRRPRPCGAKRRLQRTWCCRIGAVGFPVTTFNVPVPRLDAVGLVEEEARNAAGLVRGRVAVADEIIRALVKLRQCLGLKEKKSSEPKWPWLPDRNSNYPACC